MLLIPALIGMNITGFAQESDSLKTTRARTILFGKQNPSTMIQSYSSVSGERLLHRPEYQMESTLYGVLPGLEITKENGMPNVQANILLRGSNPLILVDGIPRSDVNVPASQIESVFLLKDALAVSMYGMAAGGGILYIKTKQGQESRMRIGFTAQLAMTNQIFRPKTLDAYNYATLFNEALANDGKQAAYTASDLDKYRSGSDPYLYPNVDWYKYILKETAPVQQYNLNFSGGSNRARYFVDLNYYNQSGFVKEDNDLNKYSTRDKYEKYSLRTNLDVDITPITYLKTSIYGQMFKDNTPGGYMSDLYTQLYTTPANAYAPVNPDGSLGGNGFYTNNIYGSAIHRGYREYNKTDLNIDLKLTQQLPMILPGLYASALYSYNSTYRESFDRSKAMAVFQYKGKDAAGEDVYQQLTNAGTQAKTSSYNRQNRMVHMEGELGYDKTWGKHTSQNKLVYLSNNYLLQNVLPFKNYGLAFRSEYNYDQRFMAEIAFSYMGMNQYKSGHRWGFFPSAGIGWNMKKESWLEDVEAIDLLKLRGTYGVNGDNMAASYYRYATGTLDVFYDYQKYYSSTTAAYFGTSPTSSSAILEAPLPYTSTWTTIRKLNLGVDLSAFNNILNLTVDFFNHNFSDVPQYRQKNSSGIVGIGFPLENIGKHRVTGFDIDLGYQQSSGDLNWYANLVSSIYKSKVIYNDEPDMPESYMKLTGQSTNQRLGYVTEGYFQNQQEIDEYMSRMDLGGYKPQPGDFKYKDLNGDNKIDGKDRQGIMSNAPRMVYGLYGGIVWKNLEFKMQWSGVLNNETYLMDKPFAINSSGVYGSAIEEHLDRWSASNPNAAYPRLSSGKNEYNERTSSHWVKKNNFLRLTNVELSYTLPKKWISHIGLSQVKVFANGYNLLTISSLKDRDPEIVSYSVMPNIKAGNFGINLQF